MQINSLMLAGYPYFYVRTDEPNRFIEEMVGEGHNVITWDIENDDAPDVLFESGNEKSIEDAPFKSVFVLKNLNWVLTDKQSGAFSPRLVQWLVNRYNLFSSKEGRKSIIICSNEGFETAIPEPLQKMFVPQEHLLPSVDELRSALSQIIDAVKANPKFVEPTDEDISHLVENARGLTLLDAKNAFAYALIKGQGQMNPIEVARLRAKEVEKVPGLKIVEADEIAEPCGYGNLKGFVLQTSGSPLAKGIMLLGPPGTGKSHFAKYIGAQSGRVVFEMEMAQLMGDGLVGQAEKAMAKAIGIIKQNAPCILFVDEIEKGLSGVGGGVSDGGTTKRSMGQFLKFLSDGRPEGVYVIATCNNISSLPPEWVRAERWDCAPFFIDLPNEEERNEIFTHYLSTFDVEMGEEFSTKGWSGAEIKSACRIAKMMNKAVSEIRGFVVPVSSTMAKEINDLRSWSTGKTIPASVISAIESDDTREIEI